MVIYTRIYVSLTVSEPPVFVLQFLTHWKWISFAFYLQFTRYNYLKNNCLDTMC